MYRQLFTSIADNYQTPKPFIVLILGLRQTGKSTLAKSVCQQFGHHQFFNFDLPSDQEEFTSQNRHSLDNFASRYQKHLILVDEIQKLPESTNTIKHLYDNYHLNFIITGSSEYKIKQHLGDTLAGRVKTYHLYPLSLSEILTQKQAIKTTETPSYDQSQIEIQKYLTHGSLPTIQNILPQDYSSFLNSFTQDLLSKDILEISQIRKSTKIYSLAKLLAMQIGQLVNVNELSILTEINRTNIYNYLDLLEQLNLIKRAYPLSTNQRQAISSKFKVYFTDLGIRNSLINNFSPLNTRLDSGLLLENAIYVGLCRQLEYQNTPHQIGFFRSKNGSEIDIVVKKNNQEFLYEVKYHPRYLNKTGNVTYITPQNAYQFLI